MLQVQQRLRPPLQVSSRAKRGHAADTVTRTSGNSVRRLSSNQTRLRVLNLANCSQKRAQNYRSARCTTVLKHRASLRTSGGIRSNKFRPRLISSSSAHASSLPMWVIFFSRLWYKDNTFVFSMRSTFALLSSTRVFPPNSACLDTARASSECAHLQRHKHENRTRTSWQASVPRACPPRHRRSAGAFARPS